MIWLLAWAAFTRLPLILSGIIPFSFDHGRDSLAVLHLIKTLNPVFLGPWTSIPGLFFGPGWYYLLAPAYWLTQGSPLAGPLTMFSLSLIGIILAYKYLGVYEAIILATAPLWLQLATGAANPFPMTLVGLLLVIALKKGWNSLWLGLILGLGFHFSSALAILWLLVIPWLVKPRQSSATLLPAKARASRRVKSPLLLNQLFTNSTWRFCRTYPGWPVLVY